MRRAHRRMLVQAHCCQLELVQLNLHFVSHIKEGDTLRGGMEAAASQVSYSSALSRGDGAEAHSAGKKHGPHTLANPDRKGRSIEGQQDGSDDNPQRKCQDEGTDREEQGEKKRKRRAKNWTDEETGMLLEAVPVKWKSKSRFCKSEDSERSFWKGVAKEVPGRDAEECRRRMETLKKSYSAIKKYCDKEKKEFGEVTEQEFGGMKLATQLLESWYKSIRDHCPPRSKKGMTKLGAGIASTSGAELDNPGVESTKLLTAAADEVTETKTRAEAVGIVVCVPRTVSWMLSIVLWVVGDVKCEP